MTSAWEAFPRQHARTRRFTLGQPRAFTVAPDGGHALFLRSPAGDDPMTALWHLDLHSGEERCLLDPADSGIDDSALPPEERARRERAREQAGGVVAYATDRSVRTVACALGGRLVVVNVNSGAARVLDVPGPVVDPRPDPTGARVAFVAEGALHVVELGSGAVDVLADDDREDVTWGLPEFVAAEEMGRMRGYWWAPDGLSLAVARVDISGVQRWHVGDPAHPERTPVVLAYPAAGTANAEVALAVIDLNGIVQPVAWDSTALPYLADVRWARDCPLTLLVQSRDQRELVLFAAEPDGTVSERHRQTDPHWVDLVPGAPQVLADGQVLHTIDVDDTRRLAVDGAPVSPVGLQVRSVVDADASAALVTGSQTDPTAVGVWRLPLDGTAPVALSRPDGVHAAGGSLDAVVLTSRSLTSSGAVTTVRTAQAELGVTSHAEEPVLTPSVELLRLGDQDLCAALCLPSWYDAANGPLPVLLDPYGGPHAQMVLQAQGAFGVSQWFAEAGFAVLIVDGRGTPGRGPAWERAVAGDLAGPPLEDQVHALSAAVALRPDVLDPTRVAMRGWSFGGFLAALAVLRRPDLFHAAIAGAPVTDWRLYDTHYTERYLGLPDAQPEAYTTSSLIADAPALERPLLLIHGLADDNVVAAHTLHLSRALLEAGRPHQVLPLVGVTHMTPQEVVAENLLRLQLRFLRDALGLGEPVR